jgi:uncharacterized phiE125 gp8 family phage protein
MINANTFELVIPAVADPITLEDAKTFCRIDGDVEDSLIVGMIKAATGITQNYAWMQWVTATYRTKIDRLEHEIFIWKNPVKTIQSVTYYDENNVLQTLSTSKYSFGLMNGCGVIRIKEVPRTYDRVDCVSILFTCGYGNQIAVPAEVKSAMYLTIGHLYEHREDVNVGVTSQQMPMGSQYILDGIKIKSI